MYVMFQIIMRFLDENPPKSTSKKFWSTRKVDFWTQEYIKIRSTFWTSSFKLYFGSMYYYIKYSNLF